MSLTDNQANQKSILFLLTQDLESPSGLGRYFPLSKNLAKQGFSVSIAALHSNFKKVKEKKFTHEGVHISYVGQMHVKKESDQTKYFSFCLLLWYSFLATWNLLNYVIKNKADIIIIGKPHPMNSVSGIIGGKFHQVKLFLDCDDYEAVSNYFSSSWQRSVIKFFENTVPKVVHCVTTNTIFNKDRMVNLGINSDKIVYLPNGVDRERFLNISEVTKNIIVNELSKKNKKIIAYIGSLNLINHPVDLLLKAQIEIIKKIPEAILLIVGGGKDIDLLKTFVLEHNLVNDVFFAGRVSPDLIPTYYSIADISIDPVYNNEEAKGRCPLKMFESWAMNTPFVTADVGDRQHLVGEYSDYTLARPGDYHDLAEKIITILKDNSLSAKLSGFYKSRVEDYYWDTIVAHNLNIFIDASKID